MSDIYEDTMKKYRKQKKKEHLKRKREKEKIINQELIKNLQITETKTRAELEEIWSEHKRKYRTGQSSTSTVVNGLLQSENVDDLVDAMTQFQTKTELIRFLIPYYFLGLKPEKKIDKEKRIAFMETLDTRLGFPLENLIEQDFKRVVEKFKQQHLKWRAENLSSIYPKDPNHPKTKAMREEWEEVKRKAGKERKEHMKKKIKEDLKDKAKFEAEKKKFEEALRKRQYEFFIRLMGAHSEYIKKLFKEM